MKWFSMAISSRMSALGFVRGKGQADSEPTVRPIYRREETERVRPTATRKIKAKYKTSMKQPTITAYLKPTCGWSQGVRAMLRKYNLPYEDRDIINNPLLYEEMVEKSGQSLSPCVEINGHILADVSGDEVEAYLS